MSQAPVLYHSFMEMLEAQAPYAVAFRFFEHGEIREITYGHFIFDINSVPINTEKKCIGIVCDGSYRSIVSIFAYANAHRQIALLTPSLERERLLRHIKLGDIDYIEGPFDFQINYAPHLTPGPKKEQDIIIFFTGGVTGAGKAVALTQESLLGSLYIGSTLLGLEKNDVLLCDFPVSHVFSFVDGLLWGLSYGIPTCFGGGPNKIVEDMHRFSPTVMPLSPLVANALFGKKAFNKELRAIMVGAEACDKLILSDIQRMGIDVYYGYGVTELSSGISMSIGKDPYCMSRNENVLLKISEEGEILAKCDLVKMKGYYHNGRIEEKGFDEEGYFHTGDLGFLDEKGYLHVTGRMDDYITLPSGKKLLASQYDEDLFRYLVSIPFTIVIDKEGKLVLVVELACPQLRIEKAVEDLNRFLPEEEQISRIKYMRSPLPRTQTGKVMRWAINPD